MTMSSDSLKYTCMALLLTAAWPAAAAPARAAEAAPAGSARITPIVTAAQMALPCVVNIGTEQMVRVYDPFDAFFNEFFGGHAKLQKEAIPLGSGVIVDTGGLVLTNHHVVARASRLMIKLYDGNTYDATLVASDATHDMALLQLKTVPQNEKLRAIAFAVPDDLLLGETAIAVGNPFGLEHSVSVGVLSARNRTFETEEKTFHDILQTDAAINPGNSGGPLVNADAQLMGLNLAIRRDAEGIGFAIPARRLEQVLAHWLLPSWFSQGTCGFVPETRVSPKKEMACVAAEVDPEGPAGKAGLKDGDRIVAAGGTAVTRALDLSRLLWRQQQGASLNLGLADGRTVSVKIAPMDATGIIRQKLGITVQELNKALVKALGLPDNVRGLTISEILTDSPLTAYGVRRGDIILGIAGTETVTAEALARGLKKVVSGGMLRIFVLALQNVRGQLVLRQVPLDVAVR